MMSVTGTVQIPHCRESKGEDGAMTRTVNISGRDGGGGPKRRVKEGNLLFKSFYVISFSLGPTLPFPLWTLLTSWRRGAGDHVIFSQQPSLIQNRNSKIRRLKYHSDPHQAL